LGEQPFDISDISFVHRIIVGSTKPDKLADEESIQQEMKLLNRCLTESPKGKIIGQEKGFNIIRIGEHQVVLQYIAYHIGFKRKPTWIE
jgi:hypothetical protein